MLTIIQIVSWLIEHQIIMEHVNGTFPHVVYSYKANILARIFFVRTVKRYTPSLWPVKTCTRTFFICRWISPTCRVYLQCMHTGTKSSIQLDHESSLVMQRHNFTHTTQENLQSNFSSSKNLETVTTNLCTTRCTDSQLHNKNINTRRHKHIATCMCINIAIITYLCNKVHLSFKDTT